MATILKNLVQFVDVAGGATLSLPHGLNDDGLALIPDTLAVQEGAEDIEVDADETNVTVTNKGGNPVSVNVLAEFWHSIERVLPPGLDDLPDKPFVYPGAGHDIGGTTLVYRQNAAGDQAPGAPVYTDWLSLYAAARAATAFGQVRIQFDSRESLHLNNLGRQACSIPAGSWDMSDITWIGLPQIVGAFGFPLGARAFSWIDILDGADISNLHMLDGEGPGIITYDGATNGPIKVSYLEVSGNWSLLNSDPAAAPMITPDGTGGIISLGAKNVYGGIGYAPFYSLVGGNQAPLIDTSPGGFQVLNHGSAVVAEDIASGTGTFTVNRGMKADGEFQSIAGTYRQPTLIADGGSTFSRLRYVGGTRYGFINLGPITAADSPFAIDSWRDVLLVDTTDGPVQVDLPSIALEGVEVDSVSLYIIDIAGHASQNPITVVPFPGEAVGDDSQWVIARDFGNIQIVARGADEQKWHIVQPLAARAQSAHTGAAPTLGNIAGAGEEGPAVAAQATWAQLSLDGFRSTGSITAIAGGSLVDGETFTVPDGINAVVFEFDDDGVVAPGNVAVPFTAADTAATVAAAIAAAIDGSALIMSTSVAAAVVSLQGPSSAAANVAIVDTVADGGFLVSGMAGAVPGSVGWVPVWQ